MPKFSRWMPSAPEHRVSFTGWVVFSVLVAGLAAAAMTWPKQVGFMLTLVAIGAILAALIETRVTNGRLQRLAAERSGEDIGTFARAFNRRAGLFDPWVVRATWDALQPYVKIRDGN